MEPIVFEIVPPPVTWSDEKISNYCRDVINTLQEQNITTIAIPEVIEELRDSTAPPHKSSYPKKLDNILFSDMLQKLKPDLNCILFKISVRLPKKEFIAWVDIIYQKGIRYIVIVGRDRDDIRYPGFEVTEAVKFLKKNYPDLHCGAITIFTRENEVDRILAKMDSGIDFFVSQIIYEAANMKYVLLHLAKECKQKGLNVPIFYLSLALASKTRDIEFMKWLGVEFPTAVFTHLTSDPEHDVEEESLQAVESTLDDILHFSEKEHINLAFNIEHIMFSNLPLSGKLCKVIRERLKKP